MRNQITIDDLLCEPEKEVEIPVAAGGEKVYTIPDDVWENRCKVCGHKNAEKNVPIPASVLWECQYATVIPCRIMGLAKANKMPGECLSFSPKYGTPGICDSCEYCNEFADGFCTKKDHAPQRRVYYGTDYGGSEKKVDYYSRHILSVCDDYEPDESVRRAEQ